MKTFCYISNERKKFKNATKPRGTMKKELTDKELLQELKRRFDLNKKMLQEERNLIAELNDVNEKLIASEHLKSNFLSNIRNEINNPIAAILELSKNIAEGEVDFESMQTLGKLIFSEAFDLDFQLRNIFLSAEIEAGESPLSVISVDIHSLFSSVIDSFKNKMDKKEIHLVKHCTIEEGTIFKTDSEKLHLILSNLISNAIQFNHHGGSIIVNCKIDEGVLIFSIQDSGIGIPDVEKEKIYNRFHQIEAGSTKTYGGHGLGLSITKALLEIIEGEISLESEVDKGSTFTIQVRELELSSGEEDVFSADGNDFLFDNDEDDMLF